MEHAADFPPVTDPSEKTAFAVWLGRALKACHEDTVHEPIPAQLLALLPQPQNER
jgi:hypothetical protein